MASIQRTITGALHQIEQIPTLMFTQEEGAHTFFITFPASMDGEDSDTVHGYFLNAEGVTWQLNGDITWTSPRVAQVTLSDACYSVPGRYVFSVYLEGETTSICLYACAGTVVRTCSDEILTQEDYPSSTIQEQIAAIKQEILSAHLMAVFAQNIADVEESIDTFQDTVDDIEDMLAAADLRKLNEPNLLTYQPQFCSVAIPSGDVITQTLTIPVEDATAAATTLTYTISDEDITASHVLHWAVSSDTTYLTWRDMVTASCSAGTATITVTARSGAHTSAITLTVCLCVQQTVTMPYGELARAYGPGPWLNSIQNGSYPGDEQDGIYERGITLTGDDIVTDLDGTSYSTAVAFYVTGQASGYNNCDELVWPSGSSSSVISDMTDGETYTLSCFARITSGSAARLRFAYGHSGSQKSYDGGSNENYVDITATTWTRVYWTFVYHATRSYVPDGGSDSITATNEKRVGVGVCRKDSGTVQLCGFRLTKGGLLGDNSVDTLAAEIEDANNSITTLTSSITSLTTQISTLSSQISALDTRVTALEGE